MNLLADLHYLNPILNVVAFLYPPAAVFVTVAENAEDMIPNIEAALKTPEAEKAIGQAKQLAVAVGAIMARHTSAGATDDEAHVKTLDQLASIHGMTPAQLRDYEQEQIGVNSQFHGVN